MALAHSGDAVWEYLSGGMERKGSVALAHFDDATREYLGGRVGWGQSVQWSLRTLVVLR